MRSGGSAIELVVKAPGGGIESWYIDPNRFLPMERVSRIWAYERAWKLHTYFSDYRAVEGVMIPHLLELEFSSLYRSMEIETVELNVALESERFRAPHEETLAGGPKK